MFAGDPRRHRQKRQMPVEATSTAASSDPSVSSSPTAAETRGSLAGTLLGSTVELEGIGKVPYVQLAIEELSRRASYLKSIWQSRDEYIRRRIAEQMTQHNVQSATVQQLRNWISNARDVYCARGPARAEEVAGLMNLAEELTKRAAAAGIPLRSSQEHTAQAAKSGEHLPSAQGEGPSVGPRHSPATGEHPTTFAHLAIAVLRSEAQFLRPLWYCGEAHAVAQHLALRMVRQGDPSPPPKVQRYWEHTRREFYRRHLRERKEHVRQLEARALALEQELQSLLSDTRGHEAAPSREAESTGKSSETPKSGKRKAKTKHLSQTPSASAGEGTSSAGEGTSSAGAASMPRSLWLTPVVALPLRAPRQGPWWPGAEAPVAGRQVSPTAEPQPKRARRSRKTSGRSPLTASGPSVGTGGQLPAQLGPASAASATPAAESDGGSSETVPAAPKKRMLLQFLATQIAAGTPSPPPPVPTVRPRSPASTASAGPPLAARPHPSLPQPARQAERPGRVSSDREPRALPLKKRPLRTPLPLVHSSPTSITQHERGPPVSGAHTTAGTEPSSGVQPPPSGKHT
uniref:KRUF family protein n=1 Tax=Toxoplasma gondii (strain ATCC 50861 / VEG) TaxID=432359 RepID=A0A0F7V4J1_TOXGV|nr:TPA: KRUF family protein [Toxoplasma gondii VEG]